MSNNLDNTCGHDWHYHQSREARKLTSEIGKDGNHKIHYCSCFGRNLPKFYWQKCRSKLVKERYCHRLEQNHQQNHQHLQASCKEKTKNLAFGSQKNPKIFLLVTRRSSTRSCGFSKIRQFQWKDAEIFLLQREETQRDVTWQEKNNIHFDVLTADNWLGSARLKIQSSWHPSFFPRKHHTSPTFYSTHVAALIRHSFRLPAVETLSYLWGGSEASCVRWANLRILSKELQSFLPGSPTGSMLSTLLS